MKVGGLCEVAKKKLFVTHKFCPENAMVFSVIKQVRAEFSVRKI